MLVYIHVPFCRSRCDYCAFHSMPLNSLSNERDALKEYEETLLKELDNSRAVLEGKPIQSVFFGGGTPSVLPPESIDAIMGRLRKNFQFSPKAEITLEANPESLRSARAAKDLLECGVNRLSIGLQSLDDKNLKILGRPHRAHEGVKAFYAAREAGFANINIDLMWGLPGQSVRQWLQTLKDAIALAPDHISSYGLTLEAGTRLEMECEKGNLALPPERDQSIMFMEGAALLEAAGYLHYEISNFARMGFQCRHNLGYWEGKDYLGLGPSSTSTINGRRWTNPSSLKAWMEAAQKGGGAKNAEVLSPQTRILELIMLRLRTARGLRLKAYNEICGRDFLRDNARLAQAMHENGLIRIRNGYLSLTRSGMLVSNSIIGSLFEQEKRIFSENEITFNAAALEDSLAGGVISPDNSQGTALPVVWPDA